MDRVFIEGISFLGHHGVTRKERDKGCQLLVDIAADFDTRSAAHSDDIADTVDHEVLARVAHELGTSASFKLLETLADRIVQAVFDATPALRVEVRVRKLTPTLPGVPAATGVTIARQRSGQPVRPEQAIV